MQHTFNWYVAFQDLTPLAGDNSSTYSVITMIRTQISLEKDMYREAKREARRQGISFAEFCRRALAQALGHRALKEPWMAYAGAVESGDENASRSVDEVVYGRRKP